MGEHTLPVPMELYKLNRERLCERLSKVVDVDAYVLLQGGSNLSHYCTDVDYIFRQVTLFHLYIKLLYLYRSSFTIITIVL